MRMIKDIRKLKTQLRNKYKNIRNNLDSSKKAVIDKEIFEKIISLECYKKCEMIITFVSTSIEVDTLELINYSLSLGKKVAVPKCIDGTREMEFHCIDSLSQLSPGAFGVLEPTGDKTSRIFDFDNSVCLVPGLAFDYDGYRLGYGKGYYDRFLSNYNSEKIGVCYCSCIAKHLPRGRFDKNVDILITEKYIRRINEEANNER